MILEREDERLHVMGAAMPPERFHLVLVLVVVLAEQLRIGRVPPDREDAHHVEPRGLRDDAGVVELLGHPLAHRLEPTRGALQDHALGGGAHHRVFEIRLQELTELKQRRLPLGDEAETARSPSADRVVGMLEQGNDRCKIHLVALEQDVERDPGHRVIVDTTKPHHRGHDRRVGAEAQRLGLRGVGVGTRLSQGEYSRPHRVLAFDTPQDKRARVGPHRICGEGTP